jgi:hypothetical protein
MNKIFNAEKTWAILFTENVKAGFDFGKDLIQIVNTLQAAIFSTKINKI